VLPMSRASALADRMTAGFDHVRAMCEDYRAVVGLANHVLVLCRELHRSDRPKPKPQPRRTCVQN
jgi:hypothetical protein